MAIGTIQDGDVRWLIKDTRSTAIAANPSKNIVGEDGLMSHEDKAKLDKILLDGNIINTTNMPPAGDNLGAVKTGSIFTMRNGVIYINDASTTGRGAVQIGTNIDVNVGVISVKTASKTDRGIVQVGERIDVSDGVISVPRVCIYSGNSDTSQNYGPQNSDNSNTYIRIVDGAIVSGVQLIGSGFTTVTSSNNKVTISTEYSDMIGAKSNAKGKKGLVPEPQAGDQDSFLRGDKSWYKFKVAHPKQNTRIEYDGNEHTPSWDNYDAAVMDMETVGSTSYTLASGVTASTALNLVTSAKSGKNAGKYVVKFTPKAPYTWIEDNSRNAFYTHWTIDKRPNTINISSSNIRTKYAIPSDVYYTTQAYDDAVSDGQTVSSVLSQLNQITISSQQLYAETHNTTYNYIPFNKTSAYFLSFKDKDDNAVDIIRHIRLTWTDGREWGRDKEIMNSPKITVTSSETNNYSKSKRVIEFPMERESKTLVQKEPESSNIVLTDTNRLAILSFDCNYGYVPNASVESTSLIECQRLEDYFKAHNTLNSSPAVIAASNLNSDLTMSNGAIRTVTMSSSDSMDNSFVDSNGTVLKNNDKIIFINNYDGNLKYYTQHTDYEYQYKLPYSVNDTVNALNVPPIAYGISSVKGMGTNYVAQSPVFETHRIKTATYVIIPKASSGECDIKIQIGAPTLYKVYTNDKVSANLHIVLDPIGANQITNVTQAAANFRSGNGANYYKIGDYISFQFTKNLTLGNNNTITGLDGNDPDDVPFYKAVLIGINHNKNHTVTSPLDNTTVYAEGIIDGGLLDANKQNAGHFCICKDEDNNDIVFAASQLHTTTNYNGWFENCTLRKWLNDSIGGFLSALPDSLKNNIKKYRKYTYLSSENTAVAGYYTDDKIWLLSQREVRSDGAYNYTYDGEWKACKRYEYFINGNSQIRGSHITGTNTKYWLRSHAINATGENNTLRKNGQKKYNGQRYMGWNSSGKPISLGAKSTNIFGISPCFVLG